jgi:hypothetical protein
VTFEFRRKERLLDASVAPFVFFFDNLVLNYFFPAPLGFFYMLSTEEEEPFVSLVVLV